MGKRTNGTYSTGNKIIGVRAEPDLLEAAEKAAKKAGTNRADFTRQILIQTLQKAQYVFQGLIPTAAKARRAELLALASSLPDVVKKLKECKVTRQFLL